MTPDQFKQLQDTLKEQIKESIDTSVNGKIDKLNEIMVAHMEDDKIIADKLVIHLVAEEKWKEQAQPIIDLGRNITGFGKVFAYGLGIIATLAAVVVAIWKGITIWKGQ